MHWMASTNYKVVFLYSLYGNGDCFGGKIGGFRQIVILKIRDLNESTCPGLLR